MNKMTKDSSGAHTDKKPVICRCASITKCDLGHKTYACVSLSAFYFQVFCKTETKLLFD